VGQDDEAAVSLFDSPEALEIGLPMVSSDDRLIATVHGGASWGEHIVLLLRNRKGTYRQRHVDLSDLAWRALARREKMPKEAEPRHQYSRILRVESKPLAVVFAMGGDYVADGLPQTQMPRRYFKYMVAEKRLEIIPEPPASK
jgi:hypothetical protein